MAAVKEINADRTFRLCSSHASASNSEKSDLTSAVDTLTKADSDALSSLQAFYGDIGVSANGKTIYPTAFKGYVYALDAASGHMLWERKIGAEMILTDQFTLQILLPSPALRYGMEAGAAVGVLIAGRMLSRNLRVAESG